MYRAVPLSSSVFHPASALSAPTGHLPLEGKALSVVILFSHMRVFALTLWRKRYSRIAAFPIGEGGPRQRRSGTLVNGALEMIFPALFHPAFPIQPPPLRGTSFHRKEGVSTQAPSLGRGCRAQRGGVGFLFCGEAATTTLNSEPRTLKSLVKQNPLTRAFSSCIITSVVVMNYVY